MSEPTTSAADTDASTDGEVAEVLRHEMAEQLKASGRNYRKLREGLVVSDKMEKTVVVEVEDRVTHPRYGKVIRRSSRLKAHDESNEVGVGDRVQIMETRPRSALEALARHAGTGEGQVTAGFARTPDPGETASHGETTERAAAPRPAHNCKDGRRAPAELPDHKASGLVVLRRRMS